MTKITQKKLLFSWDKEQKQAFKKLKELTTEVPVLQFYDPGKPVRIETDASGLAIAASLMQSDDNVPMVRDSRTISIYDQVNHRQSQSTR